MTSPDATTFFQESTGVLTKDARFDQPPIKSNNDFKHDPEVWDIIIVGAGIAGSALAYRQSLAGRRVLCLEKSLTQPDRIVGELLQPGGYMKLKHLNMADCVDGIDATKVYGYALIKDGRVSCVKYPTENYRFEVAGRSFHHGRFVQKLRTKASKSPGVTLRQGIVRKLLGVDGNDWVEETGATVGGVRYKQEDGKERTARGHLTVVCDGMYSAFRSKLWDKEKNGAPKIATPSFFVGLLLKNVHLPFPNHGHVLLGDPSPALFYPISSTEVRCLVDVPGNKLPSVSDGAMSEYLMTNVYPQVPASLQEAFQRAVVDGQIKAMQNKAVSAKPLRVMGALLLGDAYNMRHPLTGGGMTVALSDTKLICDMLQGLDADGMASLEAVTKATNSFYQTRKPLAGTINTLANALYRVFQYRPWAAHEEMRQACFEYLSLGGKCAAGPVSLLSGLNPSPSVLVAHFFSVAFFAMARLLLPRPTLKGLYMSIMVLVCASSIILPILVNEGVFTVLFPSLASTSTRKPTTDSSLFKEEEEVVVELTKATT